LHSTFMSLTLQRPTSTLFPYTTLFRSAQAARPADAAARKPPAGSARHRRVRVVDGSDARCSPRGRCLRPAAPKPSGEGGTCTDPDRKSTRLNSSHVAISYAVFCLKKKI